MDTIFGIKGKDFVIIVADSTIARSIFKLKLHEDKIFELDNDKVIALAGAVSQRREFGNFLQKNVHLYKYKNGNKLDTTTTANWARSRMAYYLRRHPW